jgi:hypothetical protein
MEMLLFKNKKAKEKIKYNFRLDLSSRCKWQKEVKK